MKELVHVQSELLHLLEHLFNYSAIDMLMVLMIKKNETHA
jgi:hypothetical protein